ncbi:hypothetical protein B0H63DRAFT_414761 [Podospora didyma]|uniref:G-protein coupled receptors family 2 profile 2 domain-containing protein n=1 Tax=Podospora didyma TaxID=330526 RepID=A0AAE0NQ80_9PEZI|nr:hypothetical protein B0H63DRAFT_414761 [Podospora didyma]
MLHLRGEASLTPDQVRVLGILTRTASTLSALGVIAIITTFVASRHFRNPMHRLIFINAFYNAFDVTCTMISTSGPQAGNPSALCQFQAFLNQMFPVADVAWTLAMAANVYLIVFRSYDTVALRKLEWKYAIVITVATFIPAFVFLFIRSDDKGLMYGSVTIWCAIAPNWVLMRIVVYYVPIWSMIFITIVLYCLVGLEIVKRRHALKSINSDSDAILLDETLRPENSAASPNHNSTGKTTAVEFDDAQSHSRQASTSHSESPMSTHHPQRLNTPRQSSALSFRQYILMPLFFFLALLSVWVAPTTNRVASFVNPSFSSYPLLLVVGTTGSLRGFWNGLVFVTIGMKSRKRRKDLEDVALHRL